MGALRGRAGCELWTAELMVLVITITSLMGCLVGAPAGDLITKLPGQPDDVGFRQYSGYVTVDESHGRNLFYYFAESRTDPAKKPLALWLNGGPGCSSLGGAFSELGPFYPNKSGDGLVNNPSSWINEANMLFLESPSGVGFSFSNTTSDYATNDAKTAQDALAFLLKWLVLYPEYQTSDFYITGESYAGHYIPQLAIAILLNNNVAGQLKIQLKGVLVGNPLFDDTIDLRRSPAEYAYGHGMMSETTYDIIVKECKFNASVIESQACTSAWNQGVDIEASLSGDAIDPYDVLEDVCVDTASQEALTLKKYHNMLRSSGQSQKETAVDPCVPNYEYAYLNQKSVQSAMHARPTQWSMCGSNIQYDYTDFSIEIAPLLSNLVTKGLQVWVYSGDADTVVAVVGTRKIVNSVAVGMNLNTTSSYAPWFQGQQVGGWSISWGLLSFVTVRGAGHMVPATQPPRALQLFSSFIAGTPLPVNPVH